MKPAVIYHQYVWLISTLRRHRRLTFEEICQRWIDDKVGDGNPLVRSTFHRHRDAILDMFGVLIDCDQKNGYQYFISNPEVLDDGTVERWMLSTLTVSNMLSVSSSIKDRIILENVPSGEDFLPTIIQAIKTNHRLLMTYQRFGADAYEKVVAPLALKLFHQRWYMLVQTTHHIATYSLDRVLSLTLTDESFEMPQDFLPQAYFAEYFGVLTDETPMAHVVLRAYGRTADYLRTLPLHNSQRELSTTREYADFGIDLRPTADFVGQLFSYDAGIEVLKPAELRQLMRDKTKEILKRY